MITAFVAVDVGLYRDGIVEYLERQDGIGVVGSGSRLEDSVELIRERKPDVVLVDARDREAIPILRRACDLNGGPHVVVLAVDEEEDDIVECARLGAAGYVSRETPLESLAAVLESATRDEVICSPKAAAMLFQLSARGAPHAIVRSDAVPKLSGREREIVERVAEGLSNKEIAERLHIELSTVKNHMHHILRKLDVKRRDEAVAVVLRENAIHVPPRRES